jgi:threonylcarbamoyladenosine tRNA methylthiotransferase MtaB
MPTKVAFYTFGCRLNQAETAIMEQGFAKPQYQIVDYRHFPDVVIVNTCTVTENGDADTRRLVNKVRRINPDAKIALVGCQAQVQKEKLLELPNVQWVVGNARKMEMEQILRENGNDSPQVIAPTIRKESFTIPFAGFDSKHTRANLKIQDGCDFFCSFCEIPYARGRARSREFEDILQEARQLAAAGHHELVLTGINIGTYQYRDKTLVEVLNALEGVEDLWRIRISSIEPTTIATGIVARMAQRNKLCRYLHIPLQSGSEVILEAMKRKYTVQKFVDFLMSAHQTAPDACLGTDIIVGFPGETDALFEETYELLLKLPFSYFHVFSYSDRDHAKSSKYGDKIPGGTIARRSHRLRELSARKRRVYFQQFLGKEEPVLFEQQKNGFWSGLTDTYIRVKVKSDLNLENQLLSVRLERIENQTMIGILV